MTITIVDDFNLDKIYNSGQAFRIKKFDDGTYRFVYLENILYIKETKISNHFDISMFSLLSKNESKLVNTASTNNPDKLIQISGSSELSTWEKIWLPYFDLARNYSQIREQVKKEDQFLQKCAAYGAGLRILKQDPWEMLVTFIISQRKNIPSIKESVEKICSLYGKQVSTDLEDLYLFPSAADMASATVSELRGCSLGYRDVYIIDAVNRVCNGELDLNGLFAADYNTIFESLLAVKGVGTKVSNCICLFAYSKTEAAPVDTWINKVIEKYYAGANPFPAYGEVAGIMQQYIFYYAQMHKDEF